MYDKTKEYEEYLKPLTDQIRSFCLLQRIPMFLSIAVKDDGSKTEYRNEVNGAFSNGITLSDDRIGKHINVSNGFETVPKRNSSGFEAFDDIEDGLGGVPDG